MVPFINRHVVCSECLSLYDYEDCIEKHGRQITIRICSECEKVKKRIPLLRQIITGNDNIKYYPYVVYPYISLVDSLKSLLSRPGFYSQCEQWRLTYDFMNESSSTSVLSDFYDGKIWRDFLCFEGKQFLAMKNSLAFMLNIDWFQPFKHRVYSVGVIYISIMNLPWSIRNKRENIIIVGLIPGPSEPSKNINSYLTPFVSDLLSLWDGISFETHAHGKQTMYGALLCIGCDLPAGRKTCGFLSYVANLGCSRCYCNFGTGIFGKQNYSGFDRNNWTMRTNKKHRDDVKSILACSSKPNGSVRKVK